MPRSDSDYLPSYAAEPSQASAYGVGPYPRAAYGSNMPQVPGPFAHPSYNQPQQQYYAGSQPEPPHLLAAPPAFRNSYDQAPPAYTAPPSSSVPYYQEAPLAPPRPYSAGMNPHGSILPSDSSRPTYNSFANPFAASTPSSATFPEPSAGATPPKTGAGTTPTGPGAGATPPGPGAGTTPTGPGTGATPDPTGTSSSAKTEETGSFYEPMKFENPENARKGPGFTESWNRMAQVVSQSRLDESILDMTSGSSASNAVVLSNLVGPDSKDPSTGAPIPGSGVKSTQAKAILEKRAEQIKIHDSEYARIQELDKQTQSKLETSDTAFEALTQDADKAKEVLAKLKANHKIIENELKALHARELQDLKSRYMEDDGHTYREIKDKDGNVLATRAQVRKHVEQLEQYLLARQSEQLKAQCELSNERQRRFKQRYENADFIASALEDKYRQERNFGHANPLKAMNGNNGWPLPKQRFFSTAQNKVGDFGLDWYDDSWAHKLEDYPHSVETTVAIDVWFGSNNDNKWFGSIRNTRHFPVTIKANKDGSAELTIKLNKGVSQKDRARAFMEAITLKHGLVSPSTKKAGISEIDISGFGLYDYKYQKQLVEHALSLNPQVKIHGLSPKLQAELSTLRGKAQDAYKKRLEERKLKGEDFPKHEKFEHTSYDPKDTHSKAHGGVTGTPSSGSAGGSPTISGSAGPSTANPSVTGALTGSSNPSITGAVPPEPGTTANPGNTGWGKPEEKSTDVIELSEPVPTPTEYRPAPDGYYDNPRPVHNSSEQKEKPVYHNPAHDPDTERHHRDAPYRGSEVGGEVMGEDDALEHMDEDARDVDTREQRKTTTISQEPEDERSVYDEDEDVEHYGVIDRGSVVYQSVDRLDESDADTNQAAEEQDTPANGRTVSQTTSSVDVTSQSAIAHEEDGEDLLEFGTVGKLNSSSKEAEAGATQASQQEQGSRIPVTQAAREERGETPKQRTTVARITQVPPTGSPLHTAAAEQAGQQENDSEQGNEVGAKFSVMPRR